jgi:SAM-dependent methyltransferase
VSERGRRADPSHFGSRASIARRAPSRYDWRSGAARIEPALRAPYERLERWARANAPGRLFLDYGCGHGIHSIAPAKGGGRVVGIDLSLDAVAIARERAARDGVADRVALVVGDAARLPFDDATFDHAIAVDVLSYVDPSVAFAELARVLRPEGSAVVIDTLGHNPVLDLHRRLRARRGERTPGEVLHVPRLRDIAVGREHFAEAETVFFDLLTLLVAPLHPGGGPLAGLARRLAALDRALLRWRPLQPLALKVMCTLSRPLRGAGGAAR